MRPVPKHLKYSQKKVSTFKINQLSMCHRIHLATANFRFRKIRHLGIMTIHRISFITTHTHTKVDNIETVFSLRENGIKEEILIKVVIMFDICLKCVLMVLEILFANAHRNYEWRNHPKWGKNHKPHNMLLNNFFFSSAVREWFLQSVLLRSNQNRIANIDVLKNRPPL